MSNWWDGIVSMGASFIKRTKRGTVMDPILYLACLVVIPSFILFGTTTFWPILVIPLIPIFYFIRVYEYNMKYTPNNLRTEEHEEAMLKIASSMGQKNKELPEAKIDVLPSSTADKNIKLEKPKLLKKQK